MVIAPMKWKSFSILAKNWVLLACSSLDLLVKQAASKSGVSLNGACERLLHLLQVAEAVTPFLLCNDIEVTRASPWLVFGSETWQNHKHNLVSCHNLAWTRVR